MSEESDKVTADSYGNVKVDAVKDESRMFRVPAILAEAWQQAPEGTVLGELVFRKGGTTMVMNGQQQHQPGAPTVAVKPSLEVIVDPNISSEAPLPRAYSLGAMTKKIPTLHPISRRPNGSIKIHGTITRTGNLHAIQDTNYNQQCETRILQSTVHNSRYVKTVEANQVVQPSQERTAGMEFGQAVHQCGKRQLDQANQHLPDSSKRIKLDQLGMRITPTALEMLMKTWSLLRNISRKTGTEFTENQATRILANELAISEHRASEILHGDPKIWLSQQEMDEVLEVLAPWVEGQSSSS
jgi:hypothetical protein